MTEKSEAFFQATEIRRSNYTLTDKSTLSNEQLEELVARAIKHNPTSYNMQQNRAVIVTGKKHAELWDLIAEEFAKINPDPTAVGRITSSFKPGYGTVVFFVDDAVVKQWGENMPPAANAFKEFAVHSNAMLQYVVWTALNLEGMGASLQHYGSFGPAIIEGVHKILDVPDSWSIPALIPFGIASGPPGHPTHPKTFEDVQGKRLLTLFDEPVSESA